MIFDIDSTPEEFHKIMLNIDARLKQSNVPFEGRPIAALSEIGKRAKKEIPLSTMPGPNGGRIEPPIVKKVNDWYEKQYADLLFMRRDLGKTIIVIQNDLFALSIPYCSGSSFRVICDKEYKKTPTVAFVDENEPPPTVNLLTCVPDFTRAMAENLNDQEIVRINQYACNVFNTFYAINIQKLKYTSTLAEIETSAAHMLASKPQYGLSKWASLQFTEKLMKSYIIKYGKKPSKTHKLLELNTILGEVGKAVPKPILDVIQCDPSVRYEGSDVSKQAAAYAHQAALTAALHLTQDQVQREAVFFT